MLDALVGGRAQDADVRHGQQGEEREPLAPLRQVEVDPRVLLRKLAGCAQAASLQQDAERDQQQSEHEREGEDQEQHDPGVGVDIAPRQRLERPEAEHRQRRAGRERHAGRGDPVTSEEEQRAQE